MIDVDLGVMVRRYPPASVSERSSPVVFLHGGYGALVLSNPDLDFTLRSFDPARPDGPDLDISR